MGEKFVNNVSTTLNGAINNSVTSLVVTSASGFPDSGTFRLLIAAESSNTDEIVTVTAVSGTTFTIVRASEATQGSQTASAHSNGAIVSQVLTVAGLESLSGGLSDYLANSGNSRNDEFAGGPSIDGKWTLVGTTPDVVDVNSTYQNKLFIKRNDTGAQLTAYYQNLPSFPCDIVLEVTADNAQAN